MANILELVSMSSTNFDEKQQHHHAEIVYSDWLKNYMTWNIQSACYETSKFVNDIGQLEPCGTIP